MIYYENKHAFGKMGENIAAKYLEKEGYKIICRNFRPKTKDIMETIKSRGEIDIIAMRPSPENTLEFFEVRTRMQASMNMPEESVTYRKIQRLTSTAMAFLSMNPKYGTSSLRISLLGLLLKSKSKNLFDLKKTRIL